ncbi:hypothetical protein SEA_SIRVICTOR_1 [Microbacterium phage SirVictor]|nr:hypothetical protein SEA_SIRVICTOR_1 [Microbacterium phage SirVictor]WNM74345.1 hypothetical protein SEA_GUETZIE_1 [Microbacterium phage Guetzie]
MPPKQRAQTPSGTGDSSGTRCTALATSGNRCRRKAMPGLTVCRSHGGGTAASIRASKRADVSQKAAKLWGISSDAGSISVKAELERLARNKLTDVTALRIELGENPEAHYGLLVDSREVTDSDVNGRTVKVGKKAGVHPLVQELHKAENELVAILRLLQEVSGGTEELDVRRIRLQTAREAARLLKAFPGISVDEVAAEVSKRA